MWPKNAVWKRIPHLMQQQGNGTYVNKVLTTFYNHFYIRLFRPKTYLNNSKWANAKTGQRGKGLNAASAF